jgi:D-glycero-D-manno-heptose 1,7-bisphosphate phosphatase
VTPRLRSGQGPGLGSGQAAVFLDRDGTLIEDIGYLRYARDVAFYPWTIDAVRALNQAGFPVVVTTNQSGVGRGILTEPMIEDVHRHVSAVLDAGGARIDAYYYCPHHPEATVEIYRKRCDCRKPGSGLIERASADLDLDPARSFVVGDKWIDVGAGRAAGARAILVRTGYGAIEETEPHAEFTADAIVDNLVEAVSWILRQC